MDTLLKESAKYIFLDIIGDIFYFPLWWYTRGAKKAFIFCANGIKDVEKYLALSVWMKNIFTPMFGQYDWQGRIISFFMRLFQIIFRSLFLLIWAILYTILFLMWLALPIFSAWRVWVHS
ncbi:MAG: hypothetical protein V1860_03190 [bacterium]